MRFVSADLIDYRIEHCRRLPIVLLGAQHAERNESPGFRGQGEGKGSGLLLALDVGRSEEICWRRWLDRCASNIRARTTT
jgi:hypothetical protein